MSNAHGLGAEAHLLGWLLLKKRKETNAGRDVCWRGCGGRAAGAAAVEKHCGGSSDSRTQSDPAIQQSPSWVHTRKRESGDSDGHLFTHVQSSQKAGTTEVSLYG